MKPVILSVVVALLLSNPVFAQEKQFDFVSKKNNFSLQEELEIGFQSSLALIKKYGYLKNPEINNYVSKIGQKIVKEVSQRPDISYRFIVLDTDEINAFAAPGGFIFITKGCLEIMENEAELAAVLAHEISHVENGDGLAAINSDQGIKDKLNVTINLANSGEGLSAKFLKMLDTDLNSAKSLEKGLVNFDKPPKDFSIMHK